MAKKKMSKYLVSILNQYGAADVIIQSPSMKEKDVIDIREMIKNRRGNNQFSIIAITKLDD